MPRERIFIFANPLAGRGRGRTLAERLKIDLQSAGYEPALLFDPPTSLPQLASESAVAAISIGGDGTLRSVANLFFSEGRQGPPLLPVPMGTANLMGQHLGIRWPRARVFEGVIATIKRRKLIQLDAGCANGEIFLLMAGIGIDAQVVHLLDSVRKGPINLASYLLPAAKAFTGYKFPLISVQADGLTLIEHKPALVFVGNVPEYGTGFPILSEASSVDGLLDVCVLPCNDWRSLVEMAMLIATGQHAWHENVIYTHAKNVSITSPDQVPMQADGDSAGFTPVKIAVLPGRIPFLVPV